MAGKKPRKKKKAANRRASQGAPGWVWMLFGLSLGLVVAAAVYVTGGRGRLPTPTPASTSAAAQEQETVPPAATQAAVESEEEAPTTPPHPATRFDFYEILPQYEVVIPEMERDAAPDRVATSIGEPGSYVLQAGSFSEIADAERAKANLALLGIQSRIQKVTIDTDDYHRVRIGPISDLDELNGIRRRLWDEEIEVLLIRIPN